MTLTQYSYIIAIDNYKSFAEAAKHCFVTQPTLSMQVKKMEEEYSVIIFDRSKQPVQVTEIGRKIIDQARVILREHERIADLINQETGELSGKFRIGIIPTIAPYLVPLFLVNFIKKYPKVELIIDELQTEQIIQKLIKDELDTAIIATPTYKKELIEKTIYYEPFVGYVSKDHKFYKMKNIDAKLLDLETVWLLKEGHCLRDQVIQVCKLLESKSTEKSAKLIFEGGSLDTLMKIVENNFGMTLLPHLATMELKNTKKWKYIREFITPIPKREINIVYHRAHLKKQLIDALKAEVISVVPITLLEKENSLIVS